MTAESSRRWASLAPRMIAAAQGWRRAIAQALAEDGLSDATALPLVHLLRDGDGIRQIELAERIGVENTALVRVLDGLEKNGMVARHPDPSDGRAKLVHLTATGRALAEHAEGVFDLLRADLTRGIPPEDLETTQRVLGRLAAALAERQQGRGPARTTPPRPGAGA